MSNDTHAYFTDFVSKASECKNVGLEIDGCNSGALAMPLRAGAYLYALIAGSGNKKNSHHQSLARIGEAILEHPHLIHGSQDFDSDIAKTFKYQSKWGVEGMQYVGAFDPQTQNVYAIGLKAHSGDQSVSFTMMSKVLEELDLIEIKDPHPKSWDPRYDGKTSAPVSSTFTPVRNRGENGTHRHDAVEVKFDEGSLQWLRELRGHMPGREKQKRSAEQTPKNPTRRSPRLSAPNGNH